LEEALTRKGGGRREAFSQKSAREKEGEGETSAVLRFDGMGIRRSLFSAAICAGYFDSLRGHPK
jgi:hypothetical protein